MSSICRKFLVFTFLIMIICWGTCLIFSLKGIYLQSFPLLYFPYFIGVLSPTIASYISMKKEKQVSSLKDWLKDMFDFKQTGLAYLLTFSLGAVFILPQCFISGYTKEAPLYAIIPLMLFMLFGGGLEEAGWRYLLQSELEKNYSFTFSTIIVSIIWWFWHLPLFYIKGTGQFGTNFIAFGITVLGISFSLAALRKAANSIFLCIVLHSFVNSLLEIFILKENILGKTTATVLLIMIAYLIILKMNRRKLIH